VQKEEIIQLLEKEHLTLVTWLEKQPDKNWEKGPDNKWTTGQHVLHLVDSLKKLNYALSIPKFILKNKYGVSNRALRPYAAVTKRYEERLAESQAKAKTFNAGLKTSPLNEKKRLIDTLITQNKKLQYKTNKWKDAHLDTLILPHPLMGKMPIREIIMWTAHHTKHHRDLLIEKY
jgi:hypothetical protein